MEAGKFKAKAVGRQFGRTAKKNEQVLVTFEITADGPNKGKQIGWYGFFTEKTVERTLEALENCGWDAESPLSELKGFGTQEVEIVLEPEKGDDGREYMRVRWVNRPGGSAKLKDELDQAGIMALSERLKGAILARKEARANEGDTSFPHGANAPGDGPPV